jgi:hypothetical protein
MEIGEPAAAPDPGANTTSDPPDDPREDGDTEITLIDELGLPLDNRSVTLRLEDGSEVARTTDGDGKFRPDLPAGTRFELVVEKAHEGRAGDATQTRSGTHFGADGTPPGGANGGGASG